MVRGLYRLLLWLHPPAFRRRFYDEMLSIYDERHSAFCLLFDALLSLARQWLWRTGSWKILAAFSAAFVEVWWFVYPSRDPQGWARSQETVTPQMQQSIVTMLAILCGLFVVILSMATWNLSLLLRRRPETRKRICQ